MCSKHQYRRALYDLRHRGSARLEDVRKSMARQRGLAQVGDRIIVVAYAAMSAEAARQHVPTVVLLDEHNAVVEAPKAA